MRELSAYLKAERSRLGLTLETVSRRTCISAQVLQALEDGDFDRIGTALLIRNFVRAYCQALEIDPAPLLDQYGSQILACDRQNEGIKRYGKWMSPFRKKSRKGKIALLLFVSITIAGPYAGIWLYDYKNRLAESRKLSTSIYPQQELPLDLPTEKPVSLSPPITGGGSSSISGDAIPQQIEEAGRITSRLSMPDGVGASGEKSSPKLCSPVNPGEILLEGEPISELAKEHLLEVEAGKKARLKVKIDGKDVYDIRLKPGEKREWKAKDTVEIESKYADALQLKWDGKLLGMPAKPGRLFRLQLPLPEEAKKP